jgi:hypothetical protein
MQQRRILREARCTDGISLREQARSTHRVLVRLQEDMDDIQLQFDELIEKMILAKMALSQTLGENDEITAEFHSHDDSPDA